ncbi:hypothetical protein V6Z11_A08G170500 [Gossypium hirsutum]
MGSDRILGKNNILKYQYVKSIFWGRFLSSYSFANPKRSSILSFSSLILLLIFPLFPLDAENGEVLSDHYKLLTVDLRNIHIFAEFISVALQAMG